MIHIIVYSLASIIALLYDIIPKKYKITRFITCFVVFLLFLAPLAFRGEQVGIDTSAYYTIFSIISAEPYPYSELRYEPGFTFLNEIIFYNNYDAPVLIAIIALLSLISIFLYLYLNTSNLVVSISIMCGIGIYGFMYNGIRQGLATGILLLGLTQLLKGKTKIYLLLNLTASLFHYSSLIFLLTYFIIKLRYTAKIAVILWILSLAFLIPSLSHTLYSGAILFIPDIYSGYADGSLDTSSFRLKVLTNQIFCLYFIFALWVNNKIEFDYKTKSLLYISLFGFIMSNVFFHMGYFDRLTLYFQAASLVAIPLLNFKMFNKKSYYLISCIIYLLFTIIYFRGLSLGANGMTPYYTYF